MPRFRIALLTLLLPTLLACGPQSGGSGVSAGRKIKVGLLSPGPISDAGWNAAAYEGLTLIQSQLGADIGQVQTDSPASREEAFRDFAEQGFDLVFGHGFEYVEAATAVHADYPNTFFVTTSGNEVRDNVGSIVFELEQSTYLCGMMAGMMSKTGKVGMIGGMNIPSIESTFKAFRAGVKDASPDCEVVSSFVGNWEDINTAKELALAQINSGVDFIFHNADAAGQGVFQAAKESLGRREVYVFGSNKNQNNVAPEVVIASAVIDIPEAFLKIAREVQQRTYTPGVRRMKIADGIIELVYNPRLKSKIPTDVLAAIHAKKQAIVNGEFEVPRGNF